MYRKIEIELTRDDDLFPVVVAFTVTPNTDSRDSPFGSGQWDISIDSVLDVDGNEVELTPWEQLLIEDQIGRTIP
jgi:hypothetical protein